MGAAQRVSKATPGGKSSPCLKECPKGSGQDITPALPVLG